MPDDLIFQIALPLDDDLREMASRFFPGVLNVLNALDVLFLQDGLHTLAYLALRHGMNEPASHFFQVYLGALDVLLQFVDRHLRCAF